MKAHFHPFIFSMSLRERSLGSKNKGSIDKTLKKKGQPRFNIERPILAVALFVFLANYIELPSVLCLRM
jgi:hypothetical protein